MKKIIFFLLFLVSTLHANPAQLGERVIAEYTTVVGFAPPQYAGLYKFSVLSNGKVQKIDNKKNVKQVAILSYDMITKLQLSIDRIDSDDLIQPGGSPCMDAPSHAISVYKLDDKKMLIWKKEKCREYHPFDDTARNVASVIKNLTNVFDQIDSLNQDNF